MKTYQETDVSYFIVIPILSIRNFFVLLPHRYRQPNQWVHQASFQCTRQAILLCFVRGSWFKPHMPPSLSGIVLLFNNAMQCTPLSSIACYKTLKCHSQHHIPSSRHGLRSSVPYSNNPPHHPPYKTAQPTTTNTTSPAVFRACLTFFAWLAFFVHMNHMYENLSM